MKKQKRVKSRKSARKTRGASSRVSGRVAKRASGRKSTKRASAKKPTRRISARATSKRVSSRKATRSSAAKRSPRRAAANAGSKRVLRRPVSRRVVAKAASKRAASRVATTPRVKPGARVITPPLVFPPLAPLPKFTRKDQLGSMEKTRARIAANAGVPVKAKAHAPAASRTPRSGGSAHGSGRPRSGTSAHSANRQLLRLAGMQQFNYMNAPGADTGFDVGNTVEVFCDHERDNERVRGWIKGVVVQVDNKLVAVQFRTNVFLTDGWMVPDRILWYSLASDQIRDATMAKRGARRPIPEF
jgi:hypothetical protein